MTREELLLALSQRKVSKDAINPTFYREEEAESSSFLRVPHGLLEHTTCDGFTFQQQVSVLSAAAEKTRERARWHGYPTVHHHRHHRREHHTRESVRFTGGRKKHNSR